MNYFTIILNSLLLFLLSNFYIFDKSYNFKIPVILTILFVLLLSIFPSALNKKLLDKKLSTIRNGYRLLIVFLANIFLDIVFYLVSIIKYHADIKILLLNTLFLILILNVVFWSGMARVYLTSTQLGIRHRVVGFILGLVPIVHLVMLVKIIKVCRDEVYFENNKLETDLARKDQKICKTKYPILLVHGIFFRDFEKLNYWGRIPDELIKNGATIYYGNHSSSLSVKDSAKELAQRIKEVIKESGCEKVNIIAHSKGGLDTRYAISNLGMDKYVASLSMINTPNHGCIFADYLMNKAPEGFKEKIASGYNFTLKKLGDKNPDFIAGVSDLTSSAVEKLNKKMPNKPGVHYVAYGSVLKGPTSGRFPLNVTNPFVKHFDGKNDGLVGIDSFAIDKDFVLTESPYHRGISHGDMIDLNRENIKGFDVREFYVKLVSDLKEQGF